MKIIHCSTTRTVCSCVSQSYEFQIHAKMEFQIPSQSSPERERQFSDFAHPQSQSQFQSRDAVNAATSNSQLYTLQPPPELNPAFRVGLFVGFVLLFVSVMLYYQPPEEGLFLKVMFLALAGISLIVTCGWTVFSFKSKYNTWVYSMPHSERKLQLETAAHRDLGKYVGNGLSSLGTQLGAGLAGAALINKN